MLKIFTSPDEHVKFAQVLLKKLQSRIDRITACKIQSCYCMSLQNEQNVDIEIYKAALNVSHDQSELLMGSSNTLIAMHRSMTASDWAMAADSFLDRMGLPVDRIERGWVYYINTASDIPLNSKEVTLISDLLLDDNRQVLHDNMSSIAQLFRGAASRLPIKIPIIEKGRSAIEEANEVYYLGLLDQDIDHLLSYYQEKNINPSASELYTFAALNSQASCHRLFKGHWQGKGLIDEQKSLFDLIQSTRQATKPKLMTQFDDDAAVIEGSKAHHIVLDGRTHLYGKQDLVYHSVFKVETQSCTIGYAADAGAASACGAQIRDQASVGRGGFAKASMVGLITSHLNLPSFRRPWEYDGLFPSFLHDARTIALKATWGFAHFNNRFGRPNIGGFLRTCEIQDHCGEHHGFHVPWMVIAGLGNIPDHAMHKAHIKPGCHLVLLGSPSMAVGVGILDDTQDRNRIFNDHLATCYDPHMQQRCQSIIDACVAKGQDNPILAIHDVCQGGLAVAITELLDDCDLGGYIQIADIPLLQKSMSPLQIWRNETEQRFVIIVNDQGLLDFIAMADREHCPYAIIGKTIDQPHLTLEGFHGSKDLIIDVPIKTLKEQLPKEVLSIAPIEKTFERFKTQDINITEAARRILQLPCVSDKTCFITIADRSVGGLVARGAMIGPWQVPVSDVGVMLDSHYDYSGQAMAMGERIPIAIIDSTASIHIAMAEALTNLMAADVACIQDVVCSVDWCGSGDQESQLRLFHACQSMVKDVCQQLGIAIAMGSDAMDIDVSYHDEKTHTQVRVKGPTSAAITLKAPVNDVRLTLTPQINIEHINDSRLLFINLAQGQEGFGGSALACVYGKTGAICPDIHDFSVFVSCIKALSDARRRGLILAYHDRSDGGLFVTIAEMCFASRLGATINLDQLDSDNYIALFSEAPGIVIQVQDADIASLRNIFNQYSLGDILIDIGCAQQDAKVVFKRQDQVILSERRVDWHKLWSHTSSQIKLERDDPACTKEAYNFLLNTQDPGLHAKLSFDIDSIQTSTLPLSDRPRVAILKEQGSYGSKEMAVAFEMSGFIPVDMTITDILQGKASLDNCIGLACVAGMTFNGIVKPAWAWSQLIVQSPFLMSHFTTFFQRSETFSFGVGDGAHLLLHLRSIIPGSEHWPTAHRNRSMQFESRLSLVRICQSDSIMLKGMQGSLLPVPVACDQGRFIFDEKYNKGHGTVPQGVCIQYINHFEYPADYYPANPTGSQFSTAALCSQDGRVTLCMLHPERVLRKVQFSWCPDQWSETSPWIKMFDNALQWALQGQDEMRRVKD